MKRARKYKHGIMTFDASEYIAVPKNKMLFDTCSSSRRAGPEHYEETTLGATTCNGTYTYSQSYTCIRSCVRAFIRIHANPYRIMSL